MGSDIPTTEKANRDTHPDTVNAFASGFAEAVLQPISGATELLGVRQPGQRTAPPSDTASKLSRDAGAMLGGAVSFIGTTALARRFFPAAGRGAPIMAGAGLGFLAPTENGTMTERIQYAALGAGTVSLFEFGPAALGRVGLRSQLGQIGVSGSVAGAFHVQADSLLKTGDFAGGKETAISALTWGGTGVAFAGAGRLLSNRNSTRPVETAETAPTLGTQHKQHFADLPTLQVGMPARPDARLTFGATSDVANWYSQAQRSVGRAEVLAHGSQGWEGRFGTVFNVSPNGRMMTANHVVKDAVDITVFDRYQRPHSARVVATNPERDLAMIQLREPASHPAFEPIPLAPLGSSPEGVFAAYGHPNGWRDLFVAPGRAIQSPRSLVAQKFEMHGQESFSGAPIIGEGGAQAILVQGARSNPFEVIATPAQHAIKLLEFAPAEAAVGTTSGVRPKLDLHLIRSFRIDDEAAAAANLSKLFGKDFSTTRPAEFFHSKIKTVEMPGTESGALTMKMQYMPNEQQVVIRPIAIDGKPITPETQWPSYKLRVDSAKLTVKLDENGAPKHMTSENDPLSVLQQGFNYRGDNNYLATLRQQKDPAWMRLLPPQLRFERLLRTGT